MAIEDIPNDNSNWAELNEFVYRSFLSCDYMGKTDWSHQDPLWEKIQTNPIERRDIIFLKNQGWKTYFSYRYTPCYGNCDFYKKEFTILPDLSPYETDKCLSHEIVHAVYGIELSRDLIFEFFDEQLKSVLRKNNAIVEWTARRIRATPTLLATIWRSFRIPPRIYDRASLLATQQLEKPQLLFPSLMKDYDFTLIN